MITAEQAIDKMKGFRPGIPVSTTEIMVGGGHFGSVLDRAVMDTILLVDMHTGAIRDINPISEFDLVMSMKRVPVVHNPAPTPEQRANLKRVADQLFGE